MKKGTLKTEPVNNLKVNLSVAERINFGALLPPKSSLSGNALSKALIKRTSITPEEIREFDMVYLPDGRVIWNKNKAKDKEFTFESFEMLHIQQGIRMHDMAQNINTENQDLAERIMAITVKSDEN